MLFIFFINKYVSNSLTSNLFIKHRDGLELYTGLKCIIHSYAGCWHFGQDISGNWHLDFSSLASYPVLKGVLQVLQIHYQYLLCAGSLKLYESLEEVRAEALERDASTIQRLLEIQCVSRYSVLPPGPILCWNSVGIYFCRVIIASKKALNPLDHSSTDILLPDSSWLYHSSDSSRFWLIWEIEGTSYNRRKYVQSQGGGPALPVSP